MKKLLLLLLMVPLAFAGWHELAAFSVLISASLLAILWMVGFGFGINELQLTAKEEAYQLIVIGVLVVLLTGGDSLLNSISGLEPLRPDASTMQEAALNIVNDNFDDVEGILNTISGYDLSLSREASKSSQCNIVGMGYSVSGCGGFSMLSTGLSMAGGIAGFALGELSAMERLLELTSKYALSLLLPVGILLRTFKLTRGGGGFLIALGISMHIMLPIGIIFNEMLAESFITSDDAGDYSETYQEVNVKTCNPGDTAPPHLAVEIISLGAASLSELGDNNEDNAIWSYIKMRESIRSALFIILAKATLGPVLALLLMTTSIRTLTSLAGAEVDVSAISRFV